MATYQLSLAEAYWEFPLAAAMVLMPIYSERSKGGDSSAPNYTQQASITARNKAKAFLNEHYQIIDDPSIPWVLA